MASERQIESNRRNAALSTGPKTPGGKASSSKNALRHGLFAREVVIPGEDPAEFLALHQSFVDEYQPAGPTEEFFVERMSNAAWRIRRLANCETVVFEEKIEQDRHYELSPPETELSTLALDVLAHAASLRRVYDFEQRLERVFHRFWLDLVEAQKARKKWEDRPPAPATGPTPAPGAKKPATVAGKPRSSSRRQPCPAAPARPATRPAAKEYRQLWRLRRRRLTR
jgi:hypothetical protein